MHLPPLSTRLMPKPPWVVLGNPLPTSMGFHTAPLLRKELTLQQMKHGHGLVLEKFSGLIIFPNTLKLLAG